MSSIKNVFLGNTVNGFLNQNALEVVTELQDSIGEGLAEIFMDLVNNVYSKMPTDLWLVDEEQYKKLIESEKKEKENKEVMVIES